MYTLKEIAEWFTNTAWLFAGQLFLVFLVLILLDICFGNRVRSSIRYGIWCLIIFKAIFPVQFALPTGISWWIQLPQAEEIFLNPDDKRSSSAFQSGNSDEALESDWDSSDAKTQQPLNASGANGTDDEMVIRLSMKSVFFLIYLMGVLGFTLYYLDRYRLLKRNDRASHSAPIEIQNLVDRLSSEIGLKTRVEVRISSYSSSPSVKGFFRPVIFVPSVLLDRLEKSSFELILLHELYHVKRGDLWMNYLQAIVHVLHFYNPVIWLANYQILKYREIATDEAVLTHQHINVKDYSHTLLNTAELTIASPVPQTFALCVAETKSKLQERIESILKRPRAKSSQLGWSGWLVITVLGFVLLPMSSARLVAGSIGDNEHFAQSNDLSVVE
ncbi:MAG: M56 family metallopeptidase, partial [Opitutales bacterium]|nr:M56 family metallopeptidase [Opitutales bacterium]